MRVLLPKVLQKNRFLSYVMLSISLHAAAVMAARSAKVPQKNDPIPTLPTHDNLRNEISRLTLSERSDYVDPFRMVEHEEISTLVESIPEIIDAGVPEASVSDTAQVVAQKTKSRHVDVSQPQIMAQPKVVPNPLSAAERQAAEKESSTLAKMGRAWVRDHVAGKTQASHPDFLSFLFKSHYWLQRTQDTVYLMPDKTAPLKLLEQEIERWVQDFTLVAKDKQLTHVDKLRKLISLIHSKAVYDPNAKYLPATLSEVEINGQRVRIGAGGQECTVRAMLAIGILARFPGLLSPGYSLVLARYRDHDDIAVYNQDQQRVLLGNYLHWQDAGQVRANLVDPLIYVASLSFKSASIRGQLEQQLLIRQSSIKQKNNTKIVVDGKRPTSPNTGGLSSANSFYQGKGEVKLKRKNYYDPASDIQPGQTITHQPPVFTEDKGSYEVSASLLIAEIKQLAKRKHQPQQAVDLLNRYIALHELMSNRSKSQAPTFMIRSRLASRIAEISIEGFDHYRFRSTYRTYALPHRKDGINSKEFDRRTLISLGLAEPLFYGAAIIKRGALQRLSRLELIPEDDKKVLYQSIQRDLNQSSERFDYELGELSAISGIELETFKARVNARVRGRVVRHLRDLLSTDVSASTEANAFAKQRAELARIKWARLVLPIPVGKSKLTDAEFFELVERYLRLFDPNEVYLPAAEPVPANAEVVGRYGSIIRYRTKDKSGRFYKLSGRALAAELAALADLAGKDLDKALTGMFAEIKEIYLSPNAIPQPLRLPEVSSLKQDDNVWAVDQDRQSYTQVDIEIIDPATEANVEQGNMLGNSRSLAGFIYVFPWQGESDFKLPNLRARLTDIISKLNVTSYAELQQELRNPGQKPR